MSQPLQTQTTVCVIHPLDPRGNKVGGIETHIRLLLRKYPQDVRLLFIGVDGIGDMSLGKVSTIEIDGRSFDFLPISHFADANVHAAAKRLSDSMTFRFAVALLKYFWSIRALLKRGRTSVELERYEFVPIIAAMRLPIVLIIHGEGTDNITMDSLLKKHRNLHRANEAVAIRLASAIVCVNPTIEAKVRRILPNNRKSIVFMPVSVDSQLFAEKPFDTSDGILRVVFAGRLDQFKDPALMFSALYEVWVRLNGKVEFHYIGTSDPGRYPEFAKIAAFTQRHGYRAQAEIAKIISRCHCGILTSIFEGMPCYLLETLSVGRPVVAVRLPQYNLVIKDGISGYLLERLPEPHLMPSAVAECMVRLWEEILQGNYSTSLIHSCVEPFSVEIGLAKLFGLHRSTLDQQV